MTGLTARQLQLWDAGGLLSPAIPSHRTAAGGYTERRYTPIELFELLVLADLRQRGFSISAASRHRRVPSRFSSVSVSSKRPAGAATCSC